MRPSKKTQYPYAGQICQTGITKKHAFQAIPYRFSAKNLLQKTRNFRPNTQTNRKLPQKNTTIMRLFQRLFFYYRQIHLFFPHKTALNETLWNKQKIIENLCNKTARKIWEEDTKTICKNFTEKRVKFIFCLFFGLNSEKKVPENTTI